MRTRLLPVNLSTRTMHLMLQVLRTALLLFVSASALANSPIRLYVDQNNDVIVEYTAAAGIPVLPFADAEANTHAIIRSKFWKSKDGCGVLEQASVVFAANCTKARFVLSWDGQTRDRVYPAIVNLSNGGRLVFLRNLHTMVGGQLSSIDAVAPAGGVVEFAGTKSSGTLTIPASAFVRDKRGWAYLGPDKFARTLAANILVDDGVPAELQQLLSSATPQLVKFYGTGLGAETKEKPSIYLHWDHRDEARENFQADVVPGGVIRFGVGGKNWATIDQERLTRFHAVLAHELAHVWNGDVFNFSHGEIPWLHEGNADLLGNTAMLALKLADGEYAGQKLSKALFDCLKAAGSQSWIAMPARTSGRVPYACGLAIQFALVANVQKAHPKIGALEFWRRFWRARPAYDENTLRLFFASLVTPAVAEKFDRLLVASNVPLHTTLRELLQSADIKLSAAPASVLTGSTVTTLMQFDCQGSASFWSNKGHLLIQKIAGCKTFKGGEKVTALEGHDLFSAPVMATLAAKAACLARRAVRFKTLEGSEFDMPCAPEAVQSLMTALPLSQFDAAQVEAILLAG